MPGKNNFDDIIRQTMAEAQQKAKQPPTAAEVDDMFSPIANMPAPGARVPVDVTSDIGRMTMGHWLEPNAAAVVDRPDTGPSAMSSDDPSLQPSYTHVISPAYKGGIQARTNAVEGAVTPDATTMLRAILARQAQGRQ